MQQILNIFSITRYFLICKKFLICGKKPQFEQKCLGLEMSFWNFGEMERMTKTMGTEMMPVSLSPRP